MLAVAHVLGLMMAFDMGGPLNKVAYTFGVAGYKTYCLSDNLSCAQE